MTHWRARNKRRVVESHLGDMPAIKLHQAVTKPKPRFVESGWKHRLGAVAAVGFVVWMILVMSSQRSRGQELPWSCAEVREAYQRLTAAQLEQIAKRYRLTQEQRAKVRACLAGKVK